MNHPEHIESAAAVLVVTSGGRLSLETARMIVQHKNDMRQAQHPCLLRRLVAWVNSLSRWPCAQGHRVGSSHLNHPYT